MVRGAPTTMTMVQTLTQIKELLASRGLSPRHRLGQNFLCDHNLIRRLVDESGVRSGDLVLEIGPGTGTLTEELLDRGCRVVACELDAGLAALLRDRFAPAIASGALRLVEADCLDGKSSLNPMVVNALGDEQFRLVANLPYGAASAVMANLALSFPRCLGQYVTIQREVGERVRAKPGTKDYGELGVVVQSVCMVRRIALLRPECFWPRPEVTSEMCAIEPLPPGRVLTRDPARLAATCRRLFTQRRKQLGTILGRGTALPEGIDASWRPERLTIAQIEALAAATGVS